MDNRVVLPLLVLVGCGCLALIMLLIRRPFIRSVKRKHVFITGGSSGIGLAIAKTALREGAYVTLVSRSATNLASAADLLLQQLPSTVTTQHIHCEAADVGDFEALKMAVQNAFTWRPVDVFVCNAGLTRGGYLGDGKLEDLEVTVRTNFMGTVNALHAALPLLKRHSTSQPVSIVIMASLASLYFMYGHSVYTATKYAMRGLAEGLRFELLLYNNMRVSLMCPGFTSTPFLDDAEKEIEILDILKWVNLYSRRWAESPEGVAMHTLNAIKKGTFLVTTSPLGLVLATLGRGFISADTLPHLVFELLMFLPFRITSLLILPIHRYIVRNKGAQYVEDASQSSNLMHIERYSTTSQSNHAN